jgi:hypothetical protein
MCQERDFRLERLPGLCRLPATRASFLSFVQRLISNSRRIAAFLEPADSV